jgi:hypothetical protein
LRLRATITQLPGHDDQQQAATLYQRIRAHDQRLHSIAEHTQAAALVPNLAAEGVVDGLDRVDDADASLAGRTRDCGDGLERADHPCAHRLRCRCLLL